MTMCQHSCRKLISRGAPRSWDILSLSLSVNSSGKQLISVFVVWIVWHFFHQHFHMNSLYRRLDFGALAVACQCHSTAPDLCAYPVKCRSNAWSSGMVDWSTKHRNEISALFPHDAGIPVSLGRAEYVLVWSSMRNLAVWSLDSICSDSDEVDRKAPLDEKEQPWQVL